MTSDSPAAIPLASWHALLPQYVMSLKCDVASICADRHWLSERWEEDGLGEVSGVLVRLASGLMLLVSERLQAPGSHGASCEVDVRVFAVRTRADIEREILAALKLDDAMVSHRPESGSEDAAKEILARWQHRGGAP